MEEGSRNSYVKIEPNAGCMAQQDDGKSPEKFCEYSMILNDAHLRECVSGYFSCLRNLLSEH
jgi:hypothetical protein